MRFLVSGVSVRVDGQVIDLGSISATECARLDAKLLGLVGRAGRDRSRGPHFQAAGAGGHGQADPPQPDDAQRLAGQLHAHELLAVPAALEQALIGRGDLPRHGQHQGDRQLGGRDGVAAGRVHHDDALLGGGLDVDVVHADAGPRDRPEPGVAVEHVGGDLHAAAADGAVGLQQGLAQVVALQAGADFHVQTPGRLQQAEAVLGQIVENNESWA